MIRGTSETDVPIARAPFWTRHRRLALVAAALAVVALAAYPSVSRWARSERSVERAALRLSTVERGDVERDVAVDGRIVAAFHPTLFSPARGLVELATAAGAVVAKDQVLARVHSPELESAWQQEASGLAALEAALGRQRLAARQAEARAEQDLDLLGVRLDAAHRAMDRAQRTFDEGLVNQIEYERAQDELKLAGLELDHARRAAELDRESQAFEVRNQELAVERQKLAVAELRRQVDALVLRAPVDGLVAGVEVEDRDAVADGQALITVVDLSSYEVEIDVPEGNAGEVTAGTPAVVTWSGRPFAGRVESMAPAVEGHRVTGRLAFTGAAPEGLKQNQRVGVRLVLEARRGVLRVERGPFLDDGGHFAYVVAGDLATRRRIEVGATSVSHVEIVGGLEEGETIVISDDQRFAGAETVLLR